MPRSQPSPTEGATKGRGKQRGRARNGQGTVRYQAARQRYEARLMIDGKPQSVYAKTEADAIAKLNDLRMRQAQGLDTSSSASKWTIGGWLDHWYENVVAPQAAPTTLDGYGISLNKHIKPFLGRVPLGKLTTERVERWQRELEAAGRGARTRHYALQRLRTALNEAAARGHILRNVAALAKTPRQDSRKHAAPNTADVARLITAMRGERLEPLLLVLLGTGLRRQVLGGSRGADSSRGAIPGVAGGPAGLPRRRTTCRTGGSKNGSWATPRTTRAISRRGFNTAADSGAC